MVVVGLLAFALIGAANTNSQETPDDIPEYDGPVGSDHALYGWKLALQNLDETFTLNPNDKLAKKIAHLEERIAEYKAASNKKNEKAALKALEVYEEKLNEIETSNIDDSKVTGLFNAVQRIQKHKFILENLTKLNPDNKGLQRAYENSNKHLTKFASKHNIDIENLTFEDDEDDLKELIKIKAKITSKGQTEVDIELKYNSNEVINTTIAEEIRNKFLALDAENITKLIKIENTSEEEKLIEELTARADIKKDGTQVEVEYEFPVAAKNKQDIIQAIITKLQGTSKEDILAVLEIKHEDEDAGVKAIQKEIKKEEQELKNEETNGDTEEIENGGVPKAEKTGVPQKDEKPE